MTYIIAFIRSVNGNRNQQSHCRMILKFFGCPNFMNFMVRMFCFFYLINGHLMRWVQILLRSEITGLNPVSSEKIHDLEMSHVMRKPVYAICEQQRQRSACADDQHLCCSLHGWNNTSTCYSRNFKTLASLNI